MPPRNEDAIGSIACPLCDRAAEVHRFTERQKVSPDGPRASYPAKVFIVCPPTSGYRGCGTILANGIEAQARVMDRAKINGAKSSPNTTTTREAQPGTPQKSSPSSPPPAKPAQPVAAPARRNPFSPF